MADVKYPDATPVDEPVAKPKAAKASKPAKSKPVAYPKDVPVDEPVRAYKKGGVIDGCAQRGKTRGKIV